jgi:hypothetical protein
MPRRYGGAAVAPSQWPLGARARAPQVVPRLSQGHPRARPVLVILAHRHLPPAPTPTSGIDRLSSPSYIANVGFKCFDYLSEILQMFHMDVTKVDQDVASVLRGMFQAFIENVSSVFSPILQQVFSCCKCFI